MAEHPRVKVPFGDSLDRESGLMVMRPSSMRDLRNVILREGSVTMRTGFGEGLELLDDDGEPMTCIVQGQALPSYGCGIVVAYKQVDEGPVQGRVFVFQVSSDGDAYDLIGEWENDREGGWGAEPPVVVMAECYGLVFMAHDEPSIMERAQTIYFDSVNGQLLGLYNDFTSPFTESEIGDTPTRFRGVCRHINYLVGWGYGTDIEDRPELVRVSLPGHPTAFKREHYAICGNPRDPVLRCLTCGDRLGILKLTEGYPFVGTSRDDFGVSPNPCDPNFGIGAGALAVNYGNGLVMAWAAGTNGPRLWDFVGPSQDVAMPLDLRGPQPDDLVAEGDVTRAFACYIPDERIVAFVFGQRLYAFSVRNEKEPRWAGYWELPEVAYCAFSLYSGQQTITAPEGFPKIDFDPTDGYVNDYDAGGTFADIIVTNQDQAGDELIEAWLKNETESGEGTWERYADRFPVALTADQPIRIEGLTPGSDYVLAVRYMRGFYPTPSHADDNPQKWPPRSRGIFTTTIDPPSIISGVWSRTAADSERITLTIRPATGQEEQDIDVYRDGVYKATISGPHTGDVTWADINPFDGSGFTDELDMESVFSYTVRSIGESALESIDSAAKQVWPGPAGIPVMQWVNTRGAGYEVGLTEEADPDVEVWDNYDNNGAIGVPANRFDIVEGQFQSASGALSNVSVPLTLDIQPRYRLTQFGVDDWGELANGAYLKTVGITPGGYDE